MDKKQALLGAAALVGVFAASPAHAAAINWDWDWQVGDFYLAAEAGHTADRGVASGHINGNGATNIFNRSGNDRRWGARSAIGYIQPVSKTGRVGIELGAGDFGTRRLSRGFNNTTGTGASNPILEMHYQGMDLMLLAMHEMEEGHILSARIGGQRLRNDLKTIDMGPVQVSGSTLTNSYFVRPTYATRLKMGLGYEYKLKERAGITANYTYFFGEKVDEYMKEPMASTFVNKPNGVPKIATFMLGLHLYF